MNVLLLTQYYPPETGAPQNRLHDFSKRLKAEGHGVEVLTAMPHYPHSKIYPGYEGRFKLTEEIDGIRVIRLSLFIPKSRSISMRLLNYLSFSLNCILFGWAQLKLKPKIIFMESPPIFLGIAGLFLARLTGARLITNISDLWPKSLVDAGYVKPGLAVSLCEWLEQKLYVHSAGVTGQTQGILDFIRSIVPQKALHLYPNGMDLESVPLLTNDERTQLRLKYGWGEDEVVVGYTGVLGYSQALDQVVQAAEYSRQNQKIKFVLFGEGPEKARIEKYIHEHPGLPLQVCGHTSRAEILKIQQAIDIALVPLSNADIFKGARPSKMFEYFAAGRPVIYCGSGEGADLLEYKTEHAGLVVEAEKPEQLFAAVTAFSSNADLRQKMGEVGRRIVREQFDRSRIARELTQFFEKISEVEQLKQHSFARRLFDVILSGLGLVLLSPLFLVVAILIKRESSGPVFYSQKRVGWYGREFSFYKFRTMRVGSDKSGEITQGLQDSRITKLGRFLRKYRIDEFPQLIHVFMGDMSFVGPRPEVKRFVDCYNSEQLQILHVKPGITDYAALEFLDVEEKILEAHPENMEEVYIRDILPKKIECNRKHLSPQSLGHDMAFICKTVRKTFDAERP